MWDTARSPATAAQCQAYIANWADGWIWVDLNLPVDSVDYYNTSNVLSPLNDVSLLTFFPSTAPANEMNCPVSQGDVLTFTVTNPQGLGQATFTTGPVQQPPQ